MTPSRTGEACMSIKDVSKRASSESLKGKNPQPHVVAEGAARNLRVQIAIDFMKTNLYRRIPLVELGRVTNLSSSRLSHVFKIQTELSPGEFLRILKMERARDLLATSLMSVKEIMAAVGYNNKSHFVRHFRRSFRLSPSEYRERISKS
jgi:transcriptional regulator GlxA family with amidase domain